MGFFQMSFSDILSTGVSRNRSSQPVKAVSPAANNPQRIYFLKIAIKREQRQACLAMPSVSDLCKSITIRFKKLDLET